MVRRSIIGCLLMITALAGMNAQSLQGLVENPVIKRYLSLHPYRLKAATEVTILSLPFFEDFTSSDVFPDPVKWSDSYAFINNSFALEPASFGVATLDAIDENGDIYAINDLPISSDKLTSMSFDLSGYTTPSDTVFLSFFYQAGGKGEAPERQDSLLLEFYSPLADVWNTVWYAVSDTLTPFLQVIMAVPDAYHQLGFRFRFRNYTSMSANEVKGGNGALSNVDCWNIDYIMLNTIPRTEHQSVSDITMADQPRELMDFYEAVPWLHLNDAQSITRNTLHYVIRNLEQGDTINLGRSYYVKNLATGEREDYEKYFGKFPPAAIESRNDPFYAPFTRGDNSTTGRLEVGAYLVTPAEQYKQNDTSKTLLVFKDYYAFDDGTPEYGFGISGESTAGALLACRFRIFTTDTLAAVDMLFNKTRNDYNADLSFHICVWADQGGLPGELLYMSEETCYPGSESGMPEFNRYRIVAEPGLVITDTIVYVGWKQVSEEFLNLGYDVNRNNLSRTFVNISGEWFNPGNSLIPGSLMIRPVFGSRNVITGTPEIPDSGTEILVYPNPASEKVYFQSGNIRIVSLKVVDLCGKMLSSTSNPGSSLDVSLLPPGLYFIQIDGNDGNTITRKIVIRH